MTLPARFYYTKTSSEPPCSRTPQGTLVVEKLINGRPCWKKLSAGSEEPKSLILADWTAGNWSEDKIKAVISKMSELIDKGFTVYIWQGDRAELLTKKSLELLNNKMVRRAMAPVAPETLISSASAEHPQQLTKANIEIIDDYSVDGLIQNKDLSIRSLDISELTAGLSPEQRGMSMISTMNIDLICENLKKAIPRLTHLSQTEYSWAALQVRNKIAEHFPSLPIEVQYRKLVLNTEQLEQLLKDKFISIDGKRFDFEQLQLIEELVLGCATWPQLEKLAPNVPKLKSLSLDSIALQSSEAKKLDFPLLEHLNLIRDEFTENNESSKIFLDSAPLLKFVHVSNTIDQKWMTGVKEQFISSSGISDEIRIVRFNIKCADDSLNRHLNKFPLIQELTGLQNIDSFNLKTKELLVSKKLYVQTKAEGWISFSDAVNHHFNKPTYSAQKAPVESTSVPISAERQQADPTHAPQSHKDFVPTKEDFVFKFKGIDTLNQGMVIERLSQYLTVTNTDKALIPKLQDGICNALTHHFITMSPEEWDALMTSIRTWDGGYDSLKEKGRVTIFDNLIKAVKEHQLSGGSAERTYVGDNLKIFFEQHPGTVILSNPWHAVAVTHSPEDNTWTICDPNFFSPPQTVHSLDALQVLLKKSLGTLFFVEGNYNTPPLVKDPQTFLRDGGLLALTQATNKKAMLDHLQAQLLSDTIYTKEALDGLLLRNIKGKPGWISGIKEPMTSEFTLNLLHQFADQNPNFLEQLQKSMEALSAHERHEGIVALTQLSPTQQESTEIPAPHEHREDTAAPTQLSPTQANQRLLAALVTGLRTVTSKDYGSQLETWRKPTATAQSLPEYCLKLVQKTAEKKRLVECDSSANVQALSLAALKHCKDTSRPVFYINSPDDLVCSASWVKRVEGNKGVLQKGPGGSLHEFLTQNAGKNPVLIVNYDHFNADDIVRFNSLLDKERLADGTPLSADTLVLGFVNPHKPTSYHGADFYSRFDSKETCPLSAEVLSASVPDQPKVAGSEADIVTINLGHAEDWEERFLGRWLIKKDQLVFEEGELERALSTKKPIKIQNGLWSNPRFQMMWQQAMILGEITHSGRTITLPKDLVWSKSEGYDWARLASRISFPATPASKPPILLNPKELGTFFHQYQCDKTKKTLDSIDGRLKQHENSTLAEHLTRTLTDDEWGLLLTECEQHEVMLSCTLEPGITLPDALANKAVLLKSPATSPWDAKKISDPLVLTSSDTTTTIAMLTHQDADWMVIDLSECEPSALLGGLDGCLKSGDKPSFEFVEKIGVLQRALAENKKVLLHGTFSEEMMDSLAPLLLNPRDKGRLVLVGENAKPFNYCPVAHHDVKADEKENALKTVLKATPQEIDTLKVKGTFETRSYNTLVAQLTYQSAFPGAEGNPWQGMDAAPPPVTITAFDAEHSEEKANAFVKKRLTQVSAVLKHAPYVYLTGPTAVGKSTFVENNLATQPGVTLYSGESRMAEWAKDESKEGMKVLFIDEANITARQWTEMEGLFNTPPGILINDIYYPLSANHKVVFAGNPLSYGGERQASPLFTRHGNAVLFEPLSPEFIYEYLLKPAFGDTPKSETLALATPILEVYRFIAQQTRHEVLISPRELQMMALMVASYAQQYPKATAEDRLLAARHYAYRLGRHLNNENHREAFQTKFKPDTPLPHETLPELKTDFLVTESRKEISQQLDDVLALRQLRQTADNDAQKYGGLGGIVLEGEPGIGKSDLVIAALLARGCTESHDYYGPPNLLGSENRFYRMPVSMQYSDKVALLLKAFQEGAVVVVDEINSSPMMERLLNSLLMGKNPEGKTPEEKLPKKTGFLIIGTQNPVTMDGRLATSTALARRLITTPLPPYNNEEMKTILVQKGLDPTEASSMVEAYEKNRTKAQQEHLKPVPTFRDLSRLAERVILEAGKKISLSQAEESQKKETEAPLDPLDLEQEPKPELELESEVEPEPDSYSEPELESYLDSDSDSDADSESEPEPELESELDPMPLDRVIAEQTEQEIQDPLSSTTSDYTALERDNKIDGPKVLSMNMKQKLRKLRASDKDEVEHQSPIKP